jgi:hypothetical protein
MQSVQELPERSHERPVADVHDDGAGVAPVSVIRSQEARNQEKASAPVWERK